MRSRKEIQQRFRDFGYDANIDQIYLSSSILAQYISQSYPTIKNVYAISKNGLVEELRLQNINIIQPQTEKINNQNIKQIVQSNTYNFDAVVVGFDDEFDYQKLAMASNILRNNKDCKFFATENTLNVSKANDAVMPSVGTIAKSIQISAGCEDPIVVTKPDTGILKLLESKYNLNRNDMIMIGDKLDTDIEMARRYEIDSLLVMTGESRKDQFAKEIESIINVQQEWIQYREHNNLYVMDSFSKE